MRRNKDTKSNSRKHRESTEQGDSVLTTEPQVDTDQLRVTNPYLKAEMKRSAKSHYVDWPLNTTMGALALVAVILMVLLLKWLFFPPQSVVMAPGQHGYGNIHYSVSQPIPFHQGY